MTTSLIAWKQFESGLNEFQEALCKDKGTLEGLTGALEMENDAIANNLAHDVKEVAKRLSEKIDNHTSSIQQVRIAHTHIHSYHMQLTPTQHSRPVPTQFSVQFLR